MQISPKELRRMADDVDDLHRDGMRTFHEEMGEVHFGNELRDGRRRFLKTAGAGGAAIAFGSALVPVSNLLPAAAAQELTDVDIAVFAQSVELAAVQAYMAGAPLLSEEVRPVGELFAQHHQEHADAFGNLAGDAATGEANAALLEALQPTLEGLSTQEDVLEFAFGVENQAVATYAFALTALTLEEAYSGTATILPIESAHAASLGMALGMPLEDIFAFDAFESSDIADGLDPAQFPVA